MEIIKHNQDQWELKVKQKNQWTVPVSSEEIQKARMGDWSIIVTSSKPVPQEWFPELNGKNVLCLASGGGQQGPVLAAAGANVTVLISPNLNWTRIDLLLNGTDCPFGRFSVR